VTNVNIKKNVKGKNTNYIHLSARFAEMPFLQLIFLL